MDITQIASIGLQAKEMFALFILSVLILFTFCSLIPLIIKTLTERFERELERQSTSHKEERGRWTQAIDKLEDTTATMGERQTVALEKLAAATNAMVVEMKDLARHRPRKVAETPKERGKSNA